MRYGGYHEDLSHGMENTTLGICTGMGYKASVCAYGYCTVRIYQYVLCFPLDSTSVLKGTIFQMPGRASNWRVQYRLESLIQVSTFTNLFACFNFSIPRYKNIRIVIPVPVPLHIPSEGYDIENLRYPRRRLVCPLPVQILSLNADCGYVRIVLACSYSMDSTLGMDSPTRISDHQSTRPYIHSFIPQVIPVSITIPGGYATGNNDPSFLPP